MPPLLFYPPPPANAQLYIHVLHPEYCTKFKEFCGYYTQVTNEAHEPPVISIHWHVLIHTILKTCSSEEWSKVSDSEKKELGITIDDNGEFWYGRQ